MNAPRFALLAAAALTAGCATAADAPSTGNEPSSVEAPLPGQASLQGPALRLEQAERSLDVGRDLPAARATLQALIAEPSVTPEQRDQARFDLSRAHEAAGDREAAIAALEALLASHEDGQRFPLDETTEARLRKLVTGADAPAPRRREDTRQASPFARALAQYFPAPSTGKATISLRILAFGGSQESSDQLGTFAVDRALHELRREACPLCEDGLSINSRSGRNGSWVGIARNRARLGKALAIYYFDLAEGRIPARYDAELPLPSAEIAARLEKGEGLVAVRERPGAPPAILIAAPREAQLVEVEEALAAMKTIPAEPMAVPLKAHLKPQEIQSVVRASFSSFRSCYEALLRSNGAAAGTVKVHFSIRGDGTVEGVTTQAEGTLHDPAFEGCLATATRVLVFPASNAATPTTVTYPIAFSP